MSDWSEHGYPGGPMVAVAGFPRPLYPPDAAPGHKPSSAGPDVEAYKRTVSRAGRWRWQPFDQAYSNAFAHGKPGAGVAESGIAGVQAQGSPQLDPTGWVGERTFKLLRSIRIPAGLPHAGEPAMDARAVELLNGAYDRFQGEDKPEPPAGTSASARLALARTQLGVTEHPADTNQCLYTDWYEAVGPWCAMFVTYCDQESLQPSEAFVQGVAYAYVPYIVNDARVGIYGLTITSSPQPGDLVCFDWDWDQTWDHVGLVDEPPDAAGSFTTVEGNTSPEGAAGSQSNGGMVCARQRNRHAQGTVFVRVAEP